MCLLRQAACSASPPIGNVVGGLPQDANSDVGCVSLHVGDCHSFGVLHVIHSLHRPHQSPSNRPVFCPTHNSCICVLRACETTAVLQADLNCPSLILGFVACSHPFIVYPKSFCNRDVQHNRRTHEFQLNPKTGVSQRSICRYRHRLRASAVPSSLRTFARSEHSTYLFFSFRPN